MWVLVAALLNWVILVLLVRPAGIAHGCSELLFSWDVPVNGSAMGLYTVWWGSATKPRRIGSGPLRVSAGRELCRWWWLTFELGVQRIQLQKRWPGFAFLLKDGLFGGSEALALWI